MLYLWATWAARNNTCLLSELTLEGVVFSFLPVLLELFDSGVTAIIR